MRICWSLISSREIDIQRGLERIECVITNSFSSVDAVALAQRARAFITRTNPVYALPIVSGDHDSVCSISCHCKYLHVVIWTHTHTHTLPRHACRNWLLWRRGHTVLPLARNSCWYHQVLALPQYHNHCQQDLQPTQHLGTCWSHSVHPNQLHQHCEYHCGRWWRWEDPRQEFCRYAKKNYRRPVTKSYT